MKVRHTCVRGVIIVDRPKGKSRSLRIPFVFSLLLAMRRNVHARTGDTPAPSLGEFSWGLTIYGKQKLTTYGFLWLFFPFFLP